MHEFFFQNFVYTKMRKFRYLKNGVLTDPLPTHTSLLGAQTTAKDSLPCPLALWTACTDQSHRENQP